MEELQTLFSSTEQSIDESKFKRRLTFYQESFTDIYPVFIIDYGNHFLTILRDLGLEIQNTYKFLNDNDINENMDKYL